MLIMCRNIPKNRFEKDSNIMFLFSNKYLVMTKNRMRGIDAYMRISVS